jgi:hypothetical protein
MRHKIFFQTSKSTKPTHTIEIDVGLSLEEFFEISSKQYKVPIHSATVERNTDIIMILNRRSFTLYMPYYLLQNGDIIIVHENLDSTYTDPIHLVTIAKEQSTPVKKKASFDDSPKISVYPQKITTGASSKNFPVVPCEIQPNYIPMVQLRKNFKFIIIGTMFTGKSTLFKQFKKLYEKEPSIDERKCFKASIYSNLILFVKTVSEEIINSGSTVKQENIEFMTEILYMEQEMLLNIEKIFDDVFSRKMGALMDDPYFQLIAQSSKYLLTFDNSKFLLENRGRIAQMDYLPTHADTIQCRIKTTGISQYSIGFSKLPQLGLHTQGDFDIYDAGGARNERKKWIFMFKNISCTFFCASLMDFTRVCYEDGITNRLHESLVVFEEICNSITLSKAPLIILFSGVDLLKNLIALDPSIAESYFGTSNLDEICVKVKEMFIKKINAKREVFVFFLNLTDLDVISRMMECVYGILPYCVFQDSRYCYTPKNKINEREILQRDFYDVWIKTEH